MLEPDGRIETMTMEPAPLPTFRSAMSEWPSGVTITTCWHEDQRPLGATLSSVTSLSLDPPMVLACFDQRSETLKSLIAGKADDKFSGIAWSSGRLGLSEIAGCAMVLGCRVEDIHPGGDHMIVTGLVLSTAVDAQRQPLVYHRRQIRALPDHPETSS